MWCKLGFFVFFRCSCLGNMISARVVMKVVVGVVLVC